MPNNGHFWSEKEITWLREEYLRKPVYMPIKKLAQILSTQCGISADAIRIRLGEFQKETQIVHQSTYPVYSEPLEMTGDALILTDVEFPFHNADFINKCLELAKAWGVKNLILGGDTLHFESLSGWEAPWNDPKMGGLNEHDADLIAEFIRALPKKYRDKGEELITDIGEQESGDGASTELAIARTELARMAKQFDHIDYVLGNHEGRFLRTMETAISPRELFRLLEIGDNDPKWRISTYYYSVLHSDGEKFHIEHPRNTAKFSAWKLASKLQSHVIMGHSHHLNFTYDISGTFYAIECGHCVDEARLPYAGQRHNTAYAHVLGAVIVRGGYPWLLTAKSDFQSLKRAK